MLKRLCLLALLAVPAGAEAQTKSVVGAALLEAVIPVSGHAYAGDAGAGLAPAAVVAGGLGLYVAGVYQWTGDFAEALGCILPDPSCRDTEDGSRSGDVLAVPGVTAMLGGKIWGVWSAVDTARQFNVSVRPSRNGIEVAVRVPLFGGRQYSANRLARRGRARAFAYDPFSLDRIVMVRTRLMRKKDIE